MAFKPRIFISSTFSDNKKVRDSIKKHFIELGAEPLLYESNLTPSTKPMTYRKDILEADFVILIMKDNYGTETDWGISGTHEEYRIAKENRIPIHVYLKPSKSQDNKLIKELLADQVSFYYFKDDVTIYNLLLNVFPEEKIKKKDFDKAMFILDFCKLIYRFTCAKKFKENNIHIFQLRLNSWGREYVQNYLEDLKDDYFTFKDYLSTYCEEQKEDYKELTTILLGDLSENELLHIDELNTMLEVKLLS